MSAFSNFAEMFFPEWAAKQATAYQKGLNQPATNFYQGLMGGNVYPSSNPDQYNGMLSQSQNIIPPDLQPVVRQAVNNGTPQMIEKYMNMLGGNYGLQQQNLGNQFMQQKIGMFGDLRNALSQIGNGSNNPSDVQRKIGYMGWANGFPGAASLVSNANAIDPSIKYNITNATNNANSGLDASGNPTGSLDQMASSVGNYMQAPPTGRYLATPEGRALMNRVRQLYPDYDEKNYQLFQKTLDNYGTGNLGYLTRRMSVAINHSNLTSQLVDQLNNGETPAINKVANYYLQQTGSQAPNNLTAAKLFLTDEITRGLIGANAGEGDRERMLSTISNSHSMEQLKGAINTYKAFMAGQLKGLRNQYVSNTGRSANEFNRLLLPGTENELDSAEKTLMTGGPNQAGWPKPGTAMNGYTYNGGDPHLQSSWTK